MKHHPMKPETIARRSAKRVVDVADREARLVRRLRENAAECGPQSIWAEMLLDHEKPAISPEFPGCDLRLSGVFKSCSDCDIAADCAEIG